MMVRGEMVLLKGIHLELCISYRKELLVMGEIILLFLRLELKKKNLL
jgi:hypothetical protein